MKKLFIVLAISSLGFAACNNSAEGEKSGDTTAVAPIDAPSVTPPAVSNDTIVNLDTNQAAPVDTAAKK
ncbi:hypothetical protein [Niabella drilacis]|uniref:Uncharacterized protein n=1 Tax=Niabella drilacis (strain DSM 25811 / CCM 8410 / CCUG 62505 / LMG 26954 / E90) TaxID=1285928 RepID=A0A1G6LPP8_NIADE|nr:hypothetical protein [Niabella drilacis]SDC44715.1 hypothetical protein SAMN04487894_102406 [Niabella drilacis]